MSNNDDTSKDKEFFELADSFIALANKHSKNAVPGKVSATFLYAAARFNTFLVASNSSSKEEFSSGKESAINYFMDEYKKMLEEHFTDYITNYDSYIKHDHNSSH